MDRDFVIRIEYNRSDQGKVVATWVHLLEDFGPSDGPRYTTWYVDYVVRHQDVKETVKTHVDFLKSFGVPKEHIHIEDRRKVDPLRAQDETREGVPRATDWD